MIINPVTVTFSRHELGAARRVIELAIANRATGKARRNMLEGAMASIDAALKADLSVRMATGRAQSSTWREPA